MEVQHMASVKVWLSALKEHDKQALGTRGTANNFTRRAEDLSWKAENHGKSLNQEPDKTDKSLLQAKITSEELRELAETTRKGVTHYRRKHPAPHKRDPLVHVGTEKVRFFRGEV